MKKIFEVCTGSLQSVENAVEGGAERIELCSALDVDGLTPSIELLKTVKKRYPNLTVHVLIRPREGNFVYDDNEKQIILKEIHSAIDCGADGIVGGALLTNGNIDIPFLKEMLIASQGRPFTFHRAFDVCDNPILALEQMKEEGVRRILTSGQQPTAEQGIPLLKELVKLAGNELIIMPGGGVNSKNVDTILKSGCVVYLQISPMFFERRCKFSGDFISSELNAITFSEKDKHWVNTSELVLNCSRYKQAKAAKKLIKICMKYLKNQKESE